MNMRGIALCGAVAWTVFATPSAAASELSDAFRGCMDNLRKVESTLNDWKEPEGRRTALAVQLVRSWRLQAALWPFIASGHWKAGAPMTAKERWDIGLSVVTACAHPDWPWDLGIGENRQ